MRSGGAALSKTPPSCPGPSLLPLGRRQREASAGGKSSGLARPQERPGAAAGDVPIHPRVQLLGSCRDLIGLLILSVKRRKREGRGRMMFFLRGRRPLGFPSFRIFFLLSLDKPKITRRETERLGLFGDPHSTPVSGFCCWILRAQA